MKNQLETFQVKWSYHQKIHKISSNLYLLSSQIFWRAIRQSGCLIIHSIMVLPLIPGKMYENCTTVIKWSFSLSLTSPRLIQTWTPKWLIPHSVTAKPHLKFLEVCLPVQECWKTQYLSWHMDIIWNWMTYWATHSTHYWRECLIAVWLPRSLASTSWLTVRYVNHYRYFCKFDNHHFPFYDLDV